MTCEWDVEVQSVQTHAPRNLIDEIQGKVCDRLVMSAPSVKVTTEDRTLIGCLLLGPTHNGRGCRSARSGRTRGAIVSEGGNIRTGGNKSIDIIGVDVWPLDSVIHSRQGGDFAGGRLV